MKRFLIIAVLTAATQTVSGQLPIDSIKAIIKQEVAAKRSKSIIVGIVDANGRRIVAEGRLSDENPRLPDGNTLYEIGSITKVFTTLLLADMSLKRKLDLNDPVSKYLPKTVNAPTWNGKEINLLSLSTHRSGLPRTAYNLDPKHPDNPYADYTMSDLYDFISTFTPTRDIDARWAYSNIGYTLLGEILATVGGKSFETLVQQEICKPLRLKSTIFTTPPRLKNLAAPYSETGQPAHPWDLPLAGGGGLRSNLNDMLTFAEANLGFIKSGLLPAMELTHVARARKDGNDTYTTMGWTLDTLEGRYNLFKDGGTGGYRTFLGIDKKNRVAVVVLTNSNNSVTDIGWHILDPNRRLQPYKYPWALLDTLRASIKPRGTDYALALYQELKAANNPDYVFNEYQLNHLGNELRKEKKIRTAIKVYELNIKEYPNSALVYESLGETYKRNNQPHLALPYFEKAKQLEPQNPHWDHMLTKLRKKK